jgi:response regulator RpfG family c-di-GMP phosphodiesterase
MPALTTISDPQSLIPIAIETLGMSEDVPFDLFIKQAAGQIVLYRAANFPFHSSDLEAMQRKGIRTLFISNSSLADYESYLHDQVLTDPNAPATARYCAVRDVNRSVFLTAMKEKCVGKVVDAASNLADELAEVVCNQEATICNLFKVMNHDYYTYTHVTNVCVYALALAQGLGISNRKELCEIATGALLHDLGKRHIPTEILNKKGQLSLEERSQINAHPLTGFAEVCLRDDLSWDQLMMLYQHHERLDGRGYPAKVAADEILPWSRLCSIVDVHDALSSYRPYRPPMRTSELCEYFTNLSGKSFDPEMVKCWLHLTLQNS